MAVNQLRSQETLTLGLLGYGKMGKAVEKIALASGFRVNLSDLSKADVFIDFSHADRVLEHCKLAAEQKKPIVIGTTGWEKQLPDVKALIKEAYIGCFYAPNFSIGVFLFTKIVEEAAKLLNTRYDAAGLEMHHDQKKDSPSGTAKAIAEKLDIPPFASLRLGSIVGTHSVFFDSDEDMITLTHQAKSRDAFAKGAVQAANWVLNKKGFFTMDDML